MKQYIKALEHILDNGKQRDDRTGVGTRGVFGYQMRFDLRNSFPAVTTKKLAWKSVVSELLWFLEGSTDERRLAEIHFGKKRDEIVNKKTIWTANANKQGVELGYLNNETQKELGPVYGKQWRSWGRDVGGEDQIRKIILDLKNNPNSRRHIVSAWNVDKIDEMALPPCHTLFQFHVQDKELSCQLYQRSADMFLGVPFNIASYACLTRMIAQVCDLEAGEFIHVIGDAHVYLNHIDALEKQLERTPKPLPHLEINPNVKNIDEFQVDDFEVIKYDCHPSIPMRMAV